MQFSQKTFGSENAIKQLYRQYSTTFKNNQNDKNKPMTQSSNLPFNKIYNAFNSTGNIKNLGLQRFKNSQARSIIEKLMQTKQKQNQTLQEQLLLMNQLKNFPIIQSKEAIPLNQTQNRIFYQIINLITEIGYIKQTTEKQTEDFQKIKSQLKNSGVTFPEVQQTKKQINTQIFKRFTKQELQVMFEENQRLQKEIQNLTKSVANKGQGQTQDSILQTVLKQNSTLKKQVNSAKAQILTSGEIDEEELQNMTIKVEQLRRDIFVLQQKRQGKFTERDQQWKFLKNENQVLRLKTVQFLKKQNFQRNTRKQQLIHILKVEEGIKQGCLDQMNNLKMKYEFLQQQNSRLRSSDIQYKNDAGLYANISPIHYDGPLQVESKVSPFQNIYAQYYSPHGFDKQNYYQNYEPERDRKNSFKRNSYSKYTHQQYSNEILTSYLNRN